MFDIPRNIERCSSSCDFCSTYLSWSSWSSFSPQVVLAKSNGDKGRRVKVKSAVLSTIPLTRPVPVLGLGEGPQFLQHGSNTRIRTLSIFVWILAFFLCHCRNIAWIIKLYVCCRKMQIFNLRIYLVLQIQTRPITFLKYVFTWSFKSEEVKKNGSDLGIPRLETLISSI